MADLMAKKKRMPPVESVPEWDENQLLDPNYFYWNVIRPAEEEAEERRERRERRRQRKARQKAKALEKAQNPPVAVVFEELPEEAQMVKVIDAMIRTTHHSYGYRHLGELGQMLREKYADLDWTRYGCKTLREFLEKYPAIFRIKQSAPAHPGKSSTWVRLAYEPKRKEGYS